MAEWDEFGWAVAAFAVAAIALFFKAIHWKGIEGWPKSTMLLRIVLLIGAVAFFGFMRALVISKKGEKPWTSMHFGTKAQPSNNAITSPTPTPPASPTPSLEAKASPSPVKRTATTPSPIPRPTITIQLPAMGNIKQRAINLSNEIMDDLFRHGWRSIDHEPPPSYAYARPMPTDPTAFNTWMLTRSAHFEFRYLPKVIELRNEFSELHLRDDRLDAFLKYRAEQNDTDKIVAAVGGTNREHPILPMDIEMIAERLNALASQIKD
jgi:hypothetical protein